MKKGSITIYFALIFMVLVSFVLSIFEGIRVHSAKLKSECAFSIASNAVLGEYQKELLEQYDLFYVDTSYQMDVSDYHYVEAHLWDYLSHNSDSELLSVRLNEITLATDNEGSSFRTQISSYMKDKVGISYIDDIREIFQSAEDIGYVEDDEEDEKEEDFDGSMGISEDTWKKTQLYYPIDDANTMRKSFVLSQVVENSQNISNKSIYSKNYVSHRECSLGTGKKEDLNFIDKIYFTQYVLDKFQNYTTKESDGELNYEVEYLLNGKDSDYENLSKTAKKLLALRELFNVAYLVTDTEKMSLIQDFSILVSLLVLCPELEPVLTASIVGVWSYQESITDVKKLLKSEKVPLMKSKESWNTDLDDMFSLSFSENTTKNEGMDYEEYLRLLMLFSDNTKITYRSMDLMEMHIRNTENNATFRMDACADEFSVHIIFDISMFGSYQMVRKFGYGL